jgi:hypothetical protein
MESMALSDEDGEHDTHYQDGEHGTLHDEDGEHDSHYLAGEHDTT